MKNIISLIAICLSFSAVAQINFPQDYLGTWKGALKMYPSGDEIPMSLQLGPELTKDSIYKYVMTYVLPARTDVRDYEIHIIDKQNGLFQVDEKNGIVLEEQLLGNKLTSVFSVSGSTLVITLELLNDQMIFEVYSWPTRASKVTGSIENEETYIVNSYELNSYQKAILKR